MGTDRLALRVHFKGNVSRLIVLNKQKQVAICSSAEDSAKGVKTEKPIQVKVKTRLSTAKRRHKEVWGNKKFLKDLDNSKLSLNVVAKKWKKSRSFIERSRITRRMELVN